MPDNRLTLTISAQNQATQALREAREQVRGLNTEIAKPRVRVAADNIRVYQDALGRLHEESGKFISRQKVLANGYTIIDQSARKAGEGIGGLNDPLAKTGSGSRGASAGLRLLGQEIQITANIARQFSRALTSQTRAIIQEAATIERLKLGLSTLSPSIAEAEAQYRRLIEVARLPGIDFSNALRASLQLQAIGKSGEEATRILIAFGNSLALSGASTADIQRTIYGLRQLIADGKVYQRELNLITSRVPVATPILQQRFGGVRADDIRSYFESIGVDESQQAAEFIRILTEELEKLPRASETAANALENIGDTSRRVQGAIGENLLPAVKEVTAAIESLLFSVEGDEELRKAAADAISLGAAMGVGTAATLTLAATIPLLAGLASPVGVVALAVGGLTAAFVKGQIEVAKFNQTVKNLEVSTPTLETAIAGTDPAVINRELERTIQARQKIVEQIESREARLTASPRVSVTQRNRINETLVDLRSQLNATLPLIEAASDRLRQLEDVSDQAVKPVDSLSGAFNGLIASASGADAEVAEALQRLEDATEGTESRSTDLARDIGSQLVSIAEATTSAQVRQAHTRVAAYARDNSLVIAEDEQLKTLLLAAEGAFQSKLSALIATEQRSQFAADRFKAVEQANQQLRGILEQLRSGDFKVDELRGVNAEFDGLVATFDRLGVLLPNVDQLRTEIAQLVNLQTALSEGQIGGDPDTRSERFSAIQRNISSGEQLLRKSTQIEKDLAEERANAEEDASETAINARKRQADEAERAAARVASNTIDRLEEEQRAREKAVTESARAVEQAQGTAERLQEQALDAETSRRIEIVQREVQQAIDRYAQMGDAYAGVIRNLTTLSEDLDMSLDTALRTERLERFRDSVRDVIENLAGIAIDSLFDRFFSGGTDDARGVFRFVEDLESTINSAAGVTGVRISALQDQLSALQATDPFVGFDLPDLSGFEFDENAPRTLDAAFADITLSSENLATAIAAITDSIKYERLEQDQARRRSRLQEDAEARLRSLQRQRQLIASRRPEGDQRGIERNLQRVQDLNFQIAEARRESRTRLTRLDEDAETRRLRFLEDALNRGSNQRTEGVSLPETLLRSVGDTISNSVSSAIGGAISNLAINALSNPIQNLVDVIRNAFGGEDDGGDTDGDGAGDGTGDGDNGYRLNARAHCAH